jgi:hypothetical protein
MNKLKVTLSLLSFSIIIKAVFFPAQWPSIHLLVLLLLLFFILSVTILINFLKKPRKKDSIRIGSDNNFQGRNVNAIEDQTARNKNYRSEGQYVFRLVITCLGIGLGLVFMSIGIDRSINLALLPTDLLIGTIFLTSLESLRLILFELKLKKK